MGYKATSIFKGQRTRLVVELWLKHNGDYATVEVLAGALEKAQRQDLVQWLQTQVQCTAAVIL